MPLALYALAVATFAIGTTEFVVVGLIPGIAADLGVSISTAGLLVSLYALSITLGTPIFSALTGGVPRRSLAITLMAVFTACNLSAAISPGYGTLLLSRIVMAIAHGVFFGVGAACATSLVPRKAGNAVAVMMGGLTVAMVIGVPLGSWIGQLFDWRTPFLIVTELGVVALLGLIWLLPHEMAYQRPAPFLAQLGLLGNRRLATMYLLTAFGFGGTRHLWRVLHWRPALEGARTAGLALRGDRHGDYSPPHRYGRTASAAVDSRLKYNVMLRRHSTEMSMRLGCESTNGRTCPIDRAAPARFSTGTMSCDRPATSASWATRSFRAMASRSSSRAGSAVIVRLRLSSAEPSPEHARTELVLGSLLRS
jgi:hypothetical protein